MHPATPDCGQGVPSFVAPARGEGTGFGSWLSHGGCHGESMGPHNVRLGATPRVRPRVGPRKSPLLAWLFCHTGRVRELTCNNFMSVLKLWKAGL